MSTGCARPGCKEGCSQCLLGWLEVQAWWRWLSLLWIIPLCTDISCR